LGVLSGEAGIGKTTVVDLFVARALITASATFSHSE
jgi:hypothetical protein